MWGPTLPIVLAEGTPFGRDWAVAAQAQQTDASNAALTAAYKQLVSFFGKVAELQEESSYTHL